MPRDRIFFLPDAVVADAPAGSRLVSMELPHARTGVPATFLVLESETTSAGGLNPAPTVPLQLYALEHVENPQSYFIDDAVVQDGSFSVATPFDVTFLMLRLLSERAAERFVMLDDLFHHQDFPDLEYLARYPNIPALLETHLCDTSAVTPTDTAYRLSPAKAHRWLRAKCDALVAAFTARTPLHPPDKLGAADPTRWQRRAVATLEAWVADAWVREALLTHFEFPEERKADALDQLLHKAVFQGPGAARRDSSAAGDEGPATKKPKPAPAKPPAKLAKGQRTISSFFGKKP
ncbi:hypothetical protein H9P43_002364 [Blastocladiella emersonii ATCC 22665]|nr:hypothetical protein H9P43_002364 [Blastocladiella emersonii ATCC 22665]